jgi:hypothetical protein
MHLLIARIAFCRDEQMRLDFTSFHYFLLLTPLSFFIQSQEKVHSFAMEFAWILLAVSQ